MGWAAEPRNQAGSRKGEPPTMSHDVDRAGKGVDNPGRSPKELAPQGPPP